MAEYRLDILQSLARQMTFAPRVKRLAQLAAAEDLLLRLDAGRGYPADFVVHAVTAFRPKSTVGPERPTASAELLAGEALQHDLGVLLEQVSDPMDLAVAEAGEPVLTIDDVCRRFGVTSKSIQRWRRKGLPARRFVFDDAKKRVGFRLSCVERFVARQEGAADRPAGVEPMTGQEQAECVRRAERLVAAGHTANEVVRRVARRLGRSSLAVLHTLEHHDRVAGASVLARATAALSDEALAALAESAEEGKSLSCAARAAGTTRTVAYRAVMERRADRIAAAPVRYHDDPLFHGDGTEPETQVAALVRQAEGALSAEAEAGERRVPRGLPPYLSDLYRTPLLTAALERALFLKFNFHKCRFAGLRNVSDPLLCRRRELDAMERQLRLARAAKNRIVTANLRLVVSVARKHARPGLDLMELVSDGNIVLMRAVEGFDVARGFRFSTYATLALMKGFARSVPQMQAALVRGDGGATDRLGCRDAALGHVRDRDEVRSLLVRLDPRERRVVSAQFGLGDEADGDDGASALDRLSESLGVTRQRVRQIEQNALDKLRRVVSA